MEEQQWWTPGTFDSRPPTGGEQLGALKELLIQGGSNVLNALEESDETIFPGRRDRIKGWGEGAENLTTRLTGNETAGKVVGALTQFGGEVVHPDTIDLAAGAATLIPEPISTGSGIVGLAGNVVRKTKQAAPDLVRAIDDAFNPVLKSRKGAYVLQGADGSQTVVRDPNGLVNNVFYSSKKELEQRMSDAYRVNKPLIKNKQGLPTFNGQIITESTLSSDPKDLINIRKQTRKKVSKFTTGTDETESAFNAMGKTLIQGDDVSPGLAEIFSSWVPKVDIIRRNGKDVIVKLDWRNHHIAPVKQLGYAVNGLKGKYRKMASDYLAKRIGNKVGMSPEQANILPHDFHVLTHRLLNDMMGKGYTIKNIEKQLGLKPGQFATLELSERKKGLDLIADSIIESKGAINTFYKYANSQLTNSPNLEPDVLVQVMEDVLNLNKRLYDLDPGQYKSLTGLVDQMVGRKGVLDSIIGGTTKGKTTVRPRSIEEQVSLVKERLANYKKTMEFKILEARSRRGGTQGVHSPSDHGFD